ncbi:MAG: bifunctional homocysteine S-methyltransferase/methylenetetrahydrofolate reductase [Anaerolineales bacterium]|nr:bifunctional homocysteine S-methyltransferase/methylenetetrahydrofolate reductase [Anaerolineales bacterium]
MNFLDALSQKTLLADGAMGTMLHARGVGFDECFDELNLSRPAVVADVHREYIEAGAELIIINTFGANRFKLAKHGLQSKVAQVNRAGVELAKRVVAASFKDVFVAGDIGPLGVRLVPYGRVKLEEARAAFAEQVNALAEAGADLFVIETIADLYETQEAVAAAKGNSSLPVIASMTFTRDDVTLLGDPPAKVARRLVAAGADVIGVNCSGGPLQLLRILKRMRQAEPRARFIVKPNAGWPQQTNGRIMYPADEEYFGEYALLFREAGATIVGGCCGTTPQHIATMKKRLDAAPAAAPLEISFAPEEEIAAAPAAQESRLAQRLADGKFSICVEMDPPRGLSTKKLLAGASLLYDSGADVINVADSPLARMRMSAWAVCDVVQRQVGVETTLHFPTRGRNLLRVQGDLLAAHALGIRNVFVVMGDPTSIGDYPEATDNYDLVPSGLVKLVKRGFNMGMDHSGASIGQPTSFFVGAALNLCPQNVESEIKNLQRKVNAGADFFLTQPVYSPDDGPKLLEAYEAKHGKLDQPIIVGVLPLVSARHANFLHNEVPGIVIPQETRKRIEAAGEDGAKVGAELAIELVDHLKSWASGAYLMPQFHRYDQVSEIIVAVKE